MPVTAKHYALAAQIEPDLDAIAEALQALIMPSVPGYDCAADDDVRQSLRLVTVRLVQGHAEELRNLIDAIDRPIPEAH